MSTVNVTCQDIYQQILELPQESLVDLARYVEFLRFKTDKTKPRTEDAGVDPQHRTGGGDLFDATTADSRGSAHSGEADLTIKLHLRPHWLTTVKFRK